jgi:hypothetical protein
MKRFFLSIAILALAVAASARTATATECYGIIISSDPSVGGCGFTGHLCDNGNGCQYDCNDGLHCYEY